MILNNPTEPRKKELSLNKEYLTVNEACAYLSLSSSGFKNLRREWNIPCSKVPAMKIMFRRIDLKRLVETYMNAPENMFPPYWDR